MQAALLLATLGFSALHAQTPVDQFFDSNGVRIRYVVQGRGEPVVLVHGYTRSIETNWIDPGVFQNLAKDHRVIALDLRGHGKSDKPHEPAAYGEMAGDVIRLMDHLSLQRAHMVGYSMGAGVVGKLLTTHPDRFLSATLGGGTPIRSLPADLDQRAETTARELASEVPFRTLVVAMTPRDEPARSEAEIRRLSAATAAGNDLKALAAYQLGGRRPLLTSNEALAAVTIPILGLAGSLDGAAQSLQQLRTIVPSMELVLIEGATHVGDRSAFARPEFVGAIRHFVAKHKSH
jgi:pimeloyl-ACP methyl ester carboxylesterase